MELAVWSHYILYDLKPELLEDMPEAKVEKAGAAPVATPKVATPTAAPTTEEPSENNGQVSAAISADEDTKSSMASYMDEDSNSAKNHNNTHSAETVSLLTASNSCVVLGLTLMWRKLCQKICKIP